MLDFLSQLILTFIQFIELRLEHFTNWIPDLHYIPSGKE